MANELDIHKSTAYRLLSTLRERGLVEQDVSSEKYRLGFGLVLLANTVKADLDILRCARPVCERLSEATSETVTVAILDGDDVAFIHQNISRLSALNVDWTGRHAPLHATAAGKVFLSGMPEPQRERLLSGKLERFTGKTISDPDTLRDHLRQVVDEGYGYTAEELEEGLNALAAPVYGADGAVVGAVGTSGPAFRLTEASIPEVGVLVREAADEISHCLGFHG